QRHPQIRLSYKEMKALEQQQYAAFPTVRPLASLRGLLITLPWATVEDIGRRARDVGRWFAEGDALRNPWRFGRFSSIQPSAVLRTDVRAILNRVRVQDAQHLDYVRRYGVGMELPPNLANFSEVGSEVLS